MGGGSLMLLMHCVECNESRAPKGGIHEFCIAKRGLKPCESLASSATFECNLRVQPSSVMSRDLC